MVQGLDVILLGPGGTYTDLYTLHSGVRQILQICFITDETMSIQQFAPSLLRSGLMLPLPMQRSFGFWLKWLAKEEIVSEPNDLEFESQEDSAKKLRAAKSALTGAWKSGIVRIPRYLTFHSMFLSLLASWAPSPYTHLLNVWGCGPRNNTPPISESHLKCLKRGLSFS